MPRPKNLADVKFYLYVSRSKVQMLYEQMYRATTGKKLQVSAPLPIGSASLEAQLPDEVDRDDMLRAVIAELEERQLVGTVEEPKTYFKGIMAMRWGLYNDHGSRPEGEPVLVYFGGYDPSANLLVGMGGSSRHVVGHEGASSTTSWSFTPTLVRWLLSGLSTDQPPDVGWREQYQEEHVLYGAMAIAQHHLKPPTQNLEFVAKTLATGEASVPPQFLGVDRTRVVLGTPLYVAQAHPSPDENRWGLDEG